MQNFRPQIVQDKISRADKKFSYLMTCEDLFKAAQNVIIATDSDGPGENLARELSRRIGRCRWLFFLS